MSSRALSLATVLLFIGFGATDTALAQAQNLEAGKSPSQLFAQTCNACHRSPRGLLKTVSPSSLSGFLRQHYTTSSEMAGVLANYLVSNGAADTRYSGGQPKGAKDGARDKETAAAQSASPGQKRVARPSDEGTNNGAKPEGQAINEHGPDGRKAKQRLSKRGKPETEVAPRTDAPKELPAPTEQSKDGDKGEAKSETAKADSGKDEVKPAAEQAAKPSAESKPDTAVKPDGDPSQSAKIEPGNAAESPALRPDPVPPVTPAPAKPDEAAAAETAAVSQAASVRVQDTPVTDAAPVPPAESAGPPTPPISK